MREVLVKGLLELQHGQSIGFEFTRMDGKTAKGFVIKYKEDFRAYYNQCNHWPVELDLGDGDFYYDKIDRITCKSHGATYQLENGFCDGGPCSGSYLKSFPMSIQNDTARINIEAF